MDEINTFYSLVLIFNGENPFPQNMILEIFFNLNYIGQDKGK